MQYRKDYLENPGKYLSGTELIFYVIDVQDHERYMEALDYIDQVLIYFKEVRENPCVAIFFHKFDPDITMDKELNRRILGLKQALTRYSHEFDILFFETTIYDIKSIMDGFSSGLSFLFEKMELISQLFMEISKNYKAILVSLFDAKGFSIGEYYRPHLQLKEKLKIYDIYIECQKRIINENRNLFEFSDKFDDGSRFSGVIEVLRFGKFDFYLLFIIEEDETDLEKTVKLLDKIEAAKPQMENLILQIIQ